MAIINAEMIDNINAEIEGITFYADVYTEEINKGIEGAQDKAQEFVNEKVNELSDMISQKADPIRERIIDIFKAQYQAALDKIKPIEPLLNISISLDTVVSVVQSIIDVLTAPYQPIIEFTTEIIPKVLELSTNLQKLAAYSPNLNLPEGVTAPALNVNIEPITPGDIMGG